MTVDRFHLIFFDEVNHQCGGLSRGQPGSVDGQIVELGVVPMDLVKSLQVALAAAVAGFDARPGAFNGNLMAASDPVHTDLQGSDDAEMENIRPVIQDHLTCSADDDRIAKPGNRASPSIIPVSLAYGRVRAGCGPNSSIAARAISGAPARLAALLIKSR
jgi:hypothetical protein